MRSPAAVTSVLPHNAIDREAVLADAYALMLAEGTPRVTMSDIARQSTVSRATLYRHWPNVAVMVNQIFESEMAAVLRAAIEQVDPVLTTRENFIAAISYITRTVRTHPLKLILVEKAPGDLARYLFDRKSRSIEHFHSVLLEYLQSFPNDGSLRTDRLAECADSIIIICTAFGMIADDLGRGAEALDRQLADVVDRLLAPVAPV